MRCFLLSYIFFLALLAVFFICRTTIRRCTRPLQTLTESADEVAKGNFNAPLPDIKHNDEIRLLRDSFRKCCGLHRLSQRHSLNR